LALILSLNSVVYSALPSISKIGKAIVSKNNSPIKYPKMPPKTEKKEASAAIFHHFFGAA